MAAAPPLAPPVQGEDKDVERSAVLTTDTTSLEPSDDLEKLGKQRPACFKSGLQEIGFLISIFGSNLLAVSFFSLFLLCLLRRETLKRVACWLALSFFSLLLLPLFPPTRC